MEKENKLIKVKQGIYNKILKKIRMFFFRFSKIESENKITPNNSTESSNVNMKSNFKEELQTAREDKTNEIQKEQFAQMISDNPKLLQQLSMERLIKIKEYYEEKIKEKQRILKKSTN